MYLSQGDVGDVVAQVQEALKSLGYNPGPSDGIYGPRTAVAVSLFQGDNGLPATGDVDTDTWTLLVGVSEAPTPASSVPVPEILREAEAGRPSPPAAEVVQAPAAIPLARTTGIIAKIQAVVNQVAPRFNLDPLLVFSVIKEESSFRPTIRNLISGATGLMQLTRVAIQDLAERFRITVTDPTDITQNVTGGTALLRAYIDQFGQDLTKGIAAFHAGPGKVARWIQQAGENWLSLAGRATRKYVDAVLNTYQTAQVGGPGAIVAASYSEGGGFLSAFLPDFSPELETIQTMVQEGPAIPEDAVTIGGPPVEGVSLLPVAAAGVAVIGVLYLMTRPRPVQAGQ